MNVNVDVTGIIIKTERLVLRNFTLDDLNDFYEYAKVPGVGEMAGWLHHQSIEESKKILKMFIEGKNQFAITLNGKVIGSLGIEKYNEEDFTELKDYKAREIGYTLSKDYWGYGYMPEAVKAVIKYFFDNNICDAFACRHHIINHQSQRVIEKCGFTYASRNSSYTTYFGETRECKDYTIFK